MADKGVLLTLLPYSEQIISEFVSRTHLSYPVSLLIS